MVKVCSSGKLRTSSIRDDFYVVEGTWNSNELIGKIKIRYSGEQVPSSNKNPDYDAINLLGNDGEVKNNQLHGKGILVL